MVDEKSLVNGNICVANKIKRQGSNPGLCDCIIGVGKRRIFLILLKGCFKNGKKTLCDFKIYNTYIWIFREHIC